MESLATYFLGLRYRFHIYREDRTYENLEALYRECDFLDKEFFHLEKRVYSSEIVDLALRHLDQLDGLVYIEKTRGLSVTEKRLAKRHFAKFFGVILTQLSFQSNGLFSRGIAK